MVEDTKAMADAVAQVLRKSNYTVDVAYDGEYGLDCGLSGIYDAIILDIMLPKLDGLRVLKELRRNKVNTPVILLTARSGTHDKVRGLDDGADDYLAKPFHTEELLARLRALGRRRAAPVGDGILRYGDLELNPLALLAGCKGKTVKLTLKESQLLELLIGMPGRIVDKGTIIEKLWGYDTEAEDNRAEVHVCLLRKKLRQLRSSTSIRTIRGLGYALKTAKDVG